MTISAKFCGTELAHISNVSSISCASSVQEVEFARSIGCVLRPSGLVTKTISIDNSLQLAKGTTRSQIEESMNKLNEHLAGKMGILEVYGVKIENCIPTSVDYGKEIMNNLLTYNISFDITDQKNKQYTISGIYSYDGRRIATFKSNQVTGMPAPKAFSFYQNCDMVRDVKYKVINKVRPDLKDNVSTPGGGGVERIQLSCWTTILESVYGRQMGLSYMLNMINSCVGEVGTLTLGTNTIKNCVIVGVNLKSLGVSNMEYEVVLSASLQC
jgi:hypothetical protein